uniref:Putative carboxypeptidase a2 ixodes scapularis carboxypeptidase a2 n=1 Tax=Amblyomma triste TaxID=251400 RepID=A0A023GPG3_AMBTT
MTYAKLRIAAALLFSLALSSALPQSKATLRVDYTGHRLVSLAPTTEAHFRLLLALEERFKADVWQEPNGFGAPALLRLRPEVADDFVNIASRSGMNVTTTSSNVQELIDNERKDMRFTTYSTEKSLFDRYLKYEELMGALKDYAKIYDHVTYTSIGRSFEGRELFGVHIKAKENLPIVFMECGIHAREWIAPSACLYFIDQLAAKYENDTMVRRLVEKYEWRIHPVVNPDGYVYSHTTDRLWRKTRSKNQFSTECVGTDGNRNFYTKNFCSKTSSTDPCKDTFCGASPFSEPEVRAIRDAVLNVRDRIEFFFSVHSFGQLWMFPHGYDLTRVPNYDELMSISLKATEAIRKVRNTQFDFGPTGYTLYEVTGRSTDWAYDHAGVRKVFTVELEPSWRVPDWRKGFMLPAREIPMAVKEAWEGLKAAVE